MREGALYLDGLLRPDDQAVAYVAAFVHSDRERPAALRIGSPGPVKIWVNGALVFAKDVVRPAVLDQDAAPVRLGRGWNRILIKTVVVDGAWRLYARLTEPSGAPLHLGAQAELPPPDARWATAATACVRRKGPGRFTRRRCSSGARRASSGEASAEAWLDLARALAWIAPRDRDAHAAADAAQRSLAARPTLGGYLVAAEVADTDDERRRDLERAGELAISAPWRALLLARLGELARTERRETRATESFRSALALDAGCWPAVLALADQESEATLPLAALARLESLPAAVQALPRVRRAAARLYEAAGRRSASDRLLTALSRRAPDRGRLSAPAGRAGPRPGRRRARRAHVSPAAAALRPDLPSLAIELARFDEGAGEGARALAGLTALAGAAAG